MAKPVCQGLQRASFRPLASRSENSRGSIEESDLVSGEDFDHRRQARRIKRTMMRRLFILRRPQTRSSERWERPVNQAQSFADFR